MDEFCWKDIALGPDLGRLNGGATDGFGSFFEYAVSFVFLNGQVRFVTRRDRTSQSHHCDLEVSLEQSSAVTLTKGR